MCCRRCFDLNVYEYLNYILLNLFYSFFLNIQSSYNLFTLTNVIKQATCIIKIPLYIFLGKVSFKILVIPLFSNQNIIYYNLSKRLKYYTKTRISLENVPLMMSDKYFVKI